MSNIVTEALKLLRVVNPREVVDGISNSDGMLALNRMMHSWKAKGVDVNHYTLEGSDDFPLGEEHEQGVIALLALRLSAPYGLALHEAAMRDAEAGWRALQAEFMQSARPRGVDAGLRALTFGVGFTGSVRRD